MFTPVQRACIRMYPEEPTVTCLGHALAACLSGVLPEELAAHGLRNSLDHARVRRTRVKPSLTEAHASWNIETLVNFRAE